MSLTAVYRSVDVDDRPRRDLRLVPILGAAYAAAWLGDGQTGYPALLLWAGCGVVGAGLLVAGRVRHPAPIVRHEQDVDPSRTKTGPRTEIDARSDAWPQAEADPRTRTRTDARSDAWPHAEADARPDVRSGRWADARSDAWGYAEADARPDVRSGRWADARPDAWGHAEADARSDARPGPWADARPNAWPHAEADPRPHARTDVRTRKDTRPHTATTTTHRRTRTLAAACLIAAGAGSAATTRAIATHTGPLPRLAAARTQVAVDAVLTDDPRVLSSRHGPFAIVPVRVERVDGLRVRLPATVLASRPDDWRLLPSTRVHLTASLRPARPGTPDAAALSVRRPPQILAGPTTLQRLAGRLRQGLRDACAGLPADPRGLLPGLVIGDVSQEPDSLSAAFRVTGLSHLTAVSGENLAFVLAAAMPIARLVGLRGRFLTLAGLAVVLAFTVLARPEPSMVRASVMALLSLLLAAVGRRARGLPLLCAGGTLLLLFDPWLARSYGFALSLSATAGLFVLAPVWQRALADRGLPHRVAESLACTAAAEAWCFPVLVSLTAEITPWCIPANLLAEVFVGPATVLGAAALLASAVWLPLGRAVAWLAQWPADGIVAVARTGSRLPGAAVSWPGGLGGSVLLLIIYTLLFLTSAAAGPRKEAR